MLKLEQVLQEVDQPEEYVRVTAYLSKQAVEDLKKRCGQLSFSKALNAILKMSLASGARGRGERK